MFSFFSSFLFSYLFNFLITTDLNSLSGKLFVYVLLGFFPSDFFFFLCYWFKHILFLIICLTFSGSYLSWSWRCFSMWEYPCAVCTCLLALLRELDLKQAVAVSYPWVCWQGEDRAGVGDLRVKLGGSHWKRKWQPTPVFFPWKSHAQRSLVGSSPWGHKRAGHNLATKHSNNRWEPRFCPMQNGQCGFTRGRVRAKEMEEEPWWSFVSLRCDFSIHLTYIWGLRTMFCASFTFSSGVDTWLEPESRLRDAAPLLSWFCSH